MVPSVGRFYLQHNKTKATLHSVCQVTTEGRLISLRVCLPPCGTTQLLQQDSADAEDRSVRDSLCSPAGSVLGHKKLFLRQHISCTKGNNKTPTLSNYIFPPQLSRQRAVCEVLIPRSINPIKTLKCQRKHTLPGNSSCLTRKEKCFSFQRWKKTTTQQ